MSQNKDFDSWNIEKKRLDAREQKSGPFPREQWVWMLTIGLNIGFEQNGGLEFSRPAIVIKKFNNQMYWVVPLSTKQKRFDFYYNYTDPEGQPVAAIAAQLRLVSIKRFRREMYKMSDNDFGALRTLLKRFI